MPFAFDKQRAGVIPVSAGQVCLITSRTSKSWIIPKGRMEAGKSAEQIALQEAWEEAGLRGALQQFVGHYRYEKCGDIYQVRVFLMQVTSIAGEWPEHLERERAWVAP